MRWIAISRGKFLVVAGSVLMLSGCMQVGDERTTLDQRWSEGQQLVLVSTPDWNSAGGELRTYERTDGAWRELGSVAPVTVGRAGSAWGLGLHAPSQEGPTKREGDGRSPAGIFEIGEAFGYVASVSTALPYQAMTATHYCMDVSGSPNYNQIVDSLVVGAAAVEGSTEPMRLDIHSNGDQRYRLGFVIRHNAGAVAMGGSCIFAHLWKSPTDATSGCTAMAPATMQRLVSWLDSKRRPIFVLLPRASHETLAAKWQLPSLEQAR